MMDVDSAHSIETVNMQQGGHKQANIYIIPYALEMRPFLGYFSGIVNIWLCRCRWL